MKERSSRLGNSLRNLTASWLNQAAVIGLGFVGRMVFVRFLSQEYLGLSGLFGDILSMLSLAELGVGTAITFQLYKPLATGEAVWVDLPRYRAEVLRFADAVEAYYRSCRPKEPGDEGEFGGPVSARLLSFGVAREFCLSRGMFEEAKLWDSRYRAAVRAADLPRRALSVRPRRWV